MFNYLLFIYIISLYINLQTSKTFQTTKFDFFTTAVYSIYPNYFYLIILTVLSMGVCSQWTYYNDYLGTTSIQIKIYLTLLFYFVLTQNITNV